MVRIRDLLQNNLAIDDVTATDKQGVFSEYADCLFSAGVVKDTEEVVRVLVEREVIGSTGMRDGVAIPHGKLPGLSKMVVCFGRSRTGIDSPSRDGKPVGLFFLFLIPPDKPGEYLKTLARISRILKNPVLRERLRSARDARELAHMILEEDDHYSQR